MEKISVTIRVRPLSKSEAAKGSPWKLGPNSIALCNASGSTISGQSYTFDRVFGSEATTLEIYEAQTKDIIGSAVQGFNGTVFAYGQTSSGKTFTMRGSPQEPGIIPLAVYEVFQNIQAVNSREFLLRVSYMEIYNEEINDLLAPEAQKLQIHESAERGIFVAGLREEIVVSPEQVLELMEFGENHRHVGETNMNVYSSRSHTIFRMVIESRDRSQDDPYGNTTVQACDAVRVSVLNLVDLAGSERVAKTGAEGARLKEGTHINKSLMTLGTVINKLSEGIQKQGGHVPYRDSKLTRILQPALGGNAKTAVICNVTPALVHADETKGTLYFASRANRVTNCAQVNEIMTDAALLKRQKKEIEELRAKLQESHSEHWEEEVLNLRNALLKTELDRERMALELQEEKKAQAERERRLKEQEQKIENLSTMVINSAVDDRDFDKRSKKNNRRETWCPRIPAEAPDDVEHQEMKRPFSKEVPWAPFGVSVLPMRRERLQCLPPPFEKLCEEEDTMFSSWKEEEDNGGVETLKGSHDSDDIFLSATLHVGERRRRSAADKEATMELKQEISNLQAQYDDLQCDNEIKMWEKMIEIEELKKELAHAQMAASKARKLDDKYQQVPEVERRVGSLDGCDVDSGFKQPRAQNLEMEKSYMQHHLGGLNQQAKCQATTAQEYLEELQNLELEKISMQQELGSLTEQVKVQATAAEDSLDKVKKELHESMKEAAAAQYELNLALQKIESLEKENEKGVEVQRELVSSIDELKCEVEAIMSTTDFASLGEIRQFFAPYLFELEQAQQEVATEKTHLVQKGETMQGWIQVLEGERDALIETTKQIEADMDRLQGMHRQELKESQKKLELALSDNVRAVEQLKAMDSFLAQKKVENQMLERKLQAIQAENESSRTALQARASEWDMTQRVHAEEKLLFKQKEEDLLSCLQVVEGEREALMKKSEQAEAEIGRLCRELDSQSQELLEAERRLEVALSEQEKVCKELSDVQIQLTAQVEEQNLLRLLLAELEAQKDAMERCFAAEEGRDAINGDLGNTKLQLFATEYSLEMKPMELKKDAGLQFLKDSNTMHKHLMSEAPAVTESMEEKLAKSAHLSAVLNQEKEIATETAKRAAEESASFRLKLEVLEHEHALLVEKLDKSEASLQSAEALAIEAVREIEKLTQELEAISAENIGAKAQLEALQQEKLAFLKDKDTMEAALAFAEKERITFKEKNDEAQEELKALDEELERQRQENDEAVSALGLAKSAAAQTAVVMKELHAMLSEREEKQQFFEHQIANFKVQAAAANADLESRTCELQENDEAQEELKALDEELERQRQENEEAVSALGLAKSAAAQAAVVMKELRVMLSEREEKQQFFEHQIANFKVQAAAANADLESRTCELQVIQKKLDLASSECSSSRAQIAEMDTLLSQKNATLEVLTGDMLNLERQFAATKQELAVRVHELEESVSKISEEKLVLLNKQELQQSTLRGVEEERDDLKSSSEVLQQDINVLTEKMEHQESQQTDMISKLENENLKFEALKFEFERQQLELHELESKLTHANSEIDDREEQLRGVHSILLENSKERKLLEEKLAKLEVEKCAMENTLAEGEAQLLVQRAAMTEATSKQEVQQQLHFTEAAQLRSDILALRKELNAAKSVPVSLEKERDGLAKELEKLKIKMKDIEAKLKSTLVEKSKLEAEKVNIDREMKQLRESTVLLNKRESIVDKRRESIATGLTKTKAQLSSAEHALQMKTVELEKSSFDLQLLQDSYAKLEFAMSEMECGSITLKEKLAESEKSITILGQEKETALHNMEKVAEELKVALEQQRVTVGDLEALQAVHLSLVQKLQVCETALKDAENLTKELSLKNDTLIKELTDAYFEFEEEKSRWASLEDNHDGECQRLGEEITKLHNQLEQLQQSYEDEVAAKNCVLEQVMKLEQALEDSAVKSFNNEKQLKEVEEAAVTTKDYFQEQVSQLEKALHDTAANSLLLEQQVKELRTALDDEQEYHRKLEEVLAVEKEKCESWEVNCKKLEEQIVLAKSTMKEEHDARMKLSEESDQEYHRKLEEVIAIEKEKCESWEINCKKLEEQIVLAKSTMKEEHDARMKLSEEIQQLNEMLEQSRADIAQTPHAEHILVLEGKQQELEEYVLKLEADCTNKEEAALLAEKQVEKLQMQLSNAMNVEESLLSELDNAGMKIKILNFEVDELQAQLDKVSSEKKDLRLQIAELNSRIEEVNSQLEHSMKELNLSQDKGAHLEKENDDYFTQNLKLEVGLDAVCDRMEVFKGRWEDAEVDMLELKERQQNAESSLEEARLEVKELHVQLESLRRRCQNCERELRMAKKKETRQGDDPVRQKQLVEVISQKDALQVQGRKAAEKQKAHQEESRKIQEVPKEKEAAVTNLKAGLDKSEGQNANLKLDLTSEMVEVKSDEKPGATVVQTVPARCKKESQMASGLSAGKSVQELKMQSDRLFKKLRMSRNQGGSIYQSNAFEDPQPPLASLNSCQGASTRPVWMKPQSGIAAAEPSSFSVNNQNTSGFTLRRAPLNPLSQNKVLAPLEAGWEKKPQPCNDSVPLKFPMHPPVSDFKTLQSSDKENL